MFDFRLMKPPIKQRGMAWEGTANLSRFVNHSDAPNVAFRKGWLVTTEDVAAGEELVARYNGSF